MWGDNKWLPCTRVGRFRDAAVECWSLTGELSLSCAWLVRENLPKTGKICLKVFIVSCIFASIQVFSTSTGMIWVTLNMPSSANHQGISHCLESGHPELMMYCLQALNPFYIFQLFSCALWFGDEYYYYSSCIIVVSCVSLAIQIYQTRSVIVYIHALGFCLTGMSPLLVTG